MNYLMVWPYGWFDRYMYRDLLFNEQVSSFYVNKPLKSNWINFLRRVHFSYRINRIIDLPGKTYWYRQLLSNINKETCVIFNTGTLSVIGWDLLKKVKAKAAKMVLLIVDSIHAHSAHIKMALPKILNFPWDIVFSYDQNDCKEFGFYYLGTSYYSAMPEITPSLHDSDIYFVGRDKAGRNSKIIDIQKKLVSLGVKCNFNLVGPKNSFDSKIIERIPGLSLSHVDIPYENVVADIKSSNCILEVVQDGQMMQTIRYFEAVCYNKKLLTNNIGLYNLPFYNPKYMKYFSSFEDIDFEWIKKKEDIDYGYKNEFSPVKILDMINNYCF